MFENLFKTELSAIKTEPLQIEKLWMEIKTSYSNPARHYHNLLHLDNLADQLFPIKDQLQDWQTIVLSIAYHDIVYNVLKHDNEEKSADLAVDRLTELSFPISKIENCKLQILATKGHQITDDPDTNYFTDADLSILGTNNISYLKYTDQIRKEYRYFPDFLYNPGRKKVLAHFLDMKTIFKTTYFQEKYERQARVNLASEMETLL